MNQWRRFFTIVLASVLCLPGLLQAAQTTAFYNSGSGTPWSVSASPTIAISASAGDTICVFSGIDSNHLNAPTVTDNKSGGSNTYNQIATNSVGLFQPEQWSQCTITSGAVTTVTVTQSGTDPSTGGIAVFVVTGSHATLIGNSNSGTQGGASSTTHSSGSVTITDASAVMIGCSNLDGGGTWTISSGFTDDAMTSSWMRCGHKSVTASETMSNTTDTSRSGVTILVEIRPAATTDQTFGFRLRVIQ